MMRIDLLIKEKFGISREKAAKLIKEGAVKADGKTVAKPSLHVEEDVKIEMLDDADTLKYVGRGGLKLERAIDAFGLDISGFVCIDVGASTGGFTDCMLQNGASKVYAVDVGTAQLAGSLKADERVVCIENMNILDFECPENADFVAADVSFVSLTKLLPKMSQLLNGKNAVVLVKPQFEAGCEHLSKKGVVKDTKVHKNVLIRVIREADSCGLHFGGLAVSPIRGGDGNTEYLLLLSHENTALDYMKAVENAVGMKKVNR